MDIVFGSIRILFSTLTGPITRNLSTGGPLTDHEPSGFYLGNWFIRQTFKYLFMLIYRPRHTKFLHLIGRENVEEALKLHQQGYQIVLVANHRSCVDVWIIPAILWLHGFRTLAQFGFFSIIGLKFFRHWYFRWLIKIGPRVAIAPESLRPKLDGLPRQKLRVQVARFRKINQEAVKVTQEQLRNGKWAFLFPEGTRSRSGILQKLNKNFLKLFLDEQGKLDPNTRIVLLPVALTGTWETWPPESSVFHWKPRHPVTMVVGKPLLLLTLREQAEVIAGVYNTGVESAAADLITYELASLLQDQGHADLCGEFNLPWSKRYGSKEVRDGRENGKVPFKPTAV